MSKRLIEDKPIGTKFTTVYGMRKTRVKLIGVTKAVQQRAKKKSKPVIYQFESLTTLRENFTSDEEYRKHRYFEMIGEQFEILVRRGIWKEIDKP